MMLLRHEHVFGLLERSNGDGIRSRSLGILPLREVGLYKAAAEKMLTSDPISKEFWEEPDDLAKFPRA